MNKLQIYCVTNERIKYLEGTKLLLAGVGKKKFSKNYITCLRGKNIQHKERNYSELTFHYWFWKNQLKNYDESTWIGFCQYRRYWLKENYDKNTRINRENLKDNILCTIPSSWKNHDSVIAKRIYVDNPKFMKLISI